jgi:superfamily I DNA/RNA helicase
VKYLAEHNQNICCVGDDDQSIYSWRGAEIKNFFQFENVYENTKIIRLEKNYRSTQNILNVASNIIENNQNRVGKTLFTDQEDGELVTLNCFRNVKDEATEMTEAPEDFKNKFDPVMDIYDMDLPIYEVLDGWREKTSDIDKYSELNSKAKKYIDRLEKIVGIPIDIISTGPNRKATILR